MAWELEKPFLTESGDPAGADKDIGAFSCQYLRADPGEGGAALLTLWWQSLSYDQEALSVSGNVREKVINTSAARAWQVYKHGQPGQTRLVCLARLVGLAGGWVILIFAVA